MRGLHKISSMLVAVATAIVLGPFCTGELVMQKPASWRSIRFQSSKYGPCHWIRDTWIWRWRIFGLVVILLKKWHHSQHEISNKTCRREVVALEKLKRFWGKREPLFQDVCSTSPQPSTNDELVVADDLQPIQSTSSSRNPFLIRDA